MVRSLFGRLAGPSLRTRVLWLVLAALVLVGLAGWFAVNRIIESLTVQFGTMIAERQVQYDRYRGMAALGREISLAETMSRSPVVLDSELAGWPKWSTTEPHLPTRVSF